MQQTSTREFLYSRMLRIRVIEQAIADIYPNREMRTPCHFYIGQEAIAAGVCAALNKTDLVYAYYRSHGWYLAKGGNLQRMIGELFGKATGCAKGYGGSMHLIDLEAGFPGTSAIVAGAIPHAVGAAFTFQARKTGQVAVSAFGDGASEEGLFQESVMFAVLRKLPIVFICENNRLATNTRFEDRQASVPIHQRAAGMGIRAEHVDGQDVEAVHMAAAQAVDMARTGQGPTLIECATDRRLEHCGPNLDHSLGHRTQQEIDYWTANDPLARIEQHIPEELRDQLRDEYTREVNESFEIARVAPFPTSLVPEGYLCV
jgi:TPP-dependent pyruvate/acetoin dehydrogenase alpha subunit